MGFTDKQKELLGQALESTKIKTRTEGKGDRAITLSFIEGYHAIYEANAIFGFDGWSYEIVECKEIVNRVYKTEKGDRVEVGYFAKVRVNAGGIYREGVGTGSGIANPSNYYKAIENAIKEAETDALKRALRSFGSKFGLALYDKQQTNVVDYKQLTTDEVQNLFDTVYDALATSESLDQLAAVFTKHKEDIASIRNNSDEKFKEIIEFKDEIKQSLQKPNPETVCKAFIACNSADELNSAALKHEKDISEFKQSEQEIVKAQFDACLQKFNVGV